MTFLEATLPYDINGTLVLNKLGLIVCKPHIAQYPFFVIPYTFIDLMWRVLD